MGLLPMSATLLVEQTKRIVCFTIVYNSSHPFTTVMSLYGRDTGKKITVEVKVFARRGTTKLGSGRERISTRFFFFFFFLNFY